MQFKTHLFAGIISASLVVSLGHASNLFCISRESIIQQISHPLHLLDPSIAFLYFLTTLAMSLFPDVDINSIPQKFFFKVVFFLMMVLTLCKLYKEVAITALITLTPLIHKHRGWTHLPITPWIIAISAIIIHNYFVVAKSSRFITSYHIFFVISVVVGHYTHLFLDSKLLQNVLRPKKFFK